MHKLIKKITAPNISFLRTFSAKRIFSAHLALIVLPSFALATIAALALSSSTSAISNPKVNVDLINGIAIHILDKNASSTITSLDLTLAASPSGSFTSDNFIAEVDTSNPTGYKLYMTSNYESPTSTIENPVYTNALVNLDNNDYTIPTLSTNTNKTDFSSGSTSGTTDKAYTNKWGYSLDDTTYSPIPEHNVFTELKDTSTTTAHDRTPVYIAMNVDLGKASGIYKNTLVFSAVANPIPTNYTLSFNLNGGSAPSESPDAFNTQTVEEVAAQHTFTIPSVSPEQSGYTFTGWLDQDIQDQIDAGTLPADTKGGLNNLYQPGDTITVIGNEEYTGAAELTAQWTLACFANSICYIANEPSGAGAVDGTMEDQTTVYLTSANINLDTTALSSSTSELTLYSPNWILSGYGFKGWNTKADGTGAMYGPNQTISTADGTLTSDMQAAIGNGGLMLYAQWVASAGNLQSWSGCSSLASGAVTALKDTRDNNVYAVAKLADDKCWMIENLRYQGGGTSSNSWNTTATNKQYNYTNLTAATASPTDNSSSGYQWRSYGNYYSWASAINSTTDYTTQYANPSSVTGSTTGICPTSWRLPRSYYNSTQSNANAEFSYLNYKLNGSYTTTSSAAGSNNWRKYPNNFVFAGLWDSSSSYYRGTLGCYWSSTVFNSNIAYRPYLYSTGVNPAYNNSKYYGYSVRCVIGD